MQKIIVTATTAPLFATQAMDGCYTDELLHGMKATVLQEYANCYHIRTFYGYKGYVHKESFIKDTASTLDYIITATHCPVLEKPDVNSRTLRYLCLGSYVAFLGIADSYRVQVRLADGVVGYIHKSWAQSITDLATLQGDSLRASICRQGRQYIDSSYLMGGKSPLGIDCSGLCSQLYLNHQRVIHRDSAFIDGSVVKEISIKQLRPADLLYFSGHIALYIGGGEYLHSSASYGGVTINSLLPTAEHYRPDLARDIQLYGTAL